MDLQAHPYVTKQYDSTVKVWIRAIVAPTAKNAASKNHPKDILRDKNHLYRIVLVHLILNNAFKQKKSSDGWILKISKIIKTRNFI